MAAWGYEEVVARYRDEFPKYERLASLMGTMLETALRDDGYRLAEVSSRAKDVDSFGKKAMRKSYRDPLAEIEDKAGVRVVIPFARDRAPVETTAARVLILEDRDDKRAALTIDRLGYLGIHFRVRVRPELLSKPNKDLDGLWAEFQLHTKAENAWSVATHDTLYKAAVDVPPAVARRMMRLVALVEVFDDEVGRFQSELSALPGFRELGALVPPLERELLRFTRRDPDIALSGLVIPALAPLYARDDPLSIFTEVLCPYIEQRRDELRQLYERYEDDVRANPLLFQPEALMLFERLEHDRFRLRENWPPQVSLDVLLNLADIRGVSYG